MKSIEQARQEAESLSPLIAEYEAEFNDLKRREPSVLASCIARHKKEDDTYQWAKNEALNDPVYLEHLERMKAAQAQYLEYERAFRTVIDYLRAVTSENYKQHAKIKSGIL